MVARPVRRPCKADSVRMKYRVAGEGNAHLVFAITGIGLGVFGVIFPGGVPQLIAALGAQRFFIAADALVAVAGLMTNIFMPICDGGPTDVKGSGPLPASVWSAIIGVTGLALVQGMTFSFLVQSGSRHEFSFW